MKIVLSILLVALLCSNYAEAIGSMSIKEQVRKFVNRGRPENFGVTWLEIADAFLEGADIDTLLGNSTECFHATEHAGEDIAEAVNHIITRGFSWENYLDVLGASGDISPMMRVCYDVGNDGWKEAIEHFRAFKSFVDFVMQCKDNAVIHLFDWYDIYDKITRAIDTKKPKDISFQIGRGLRLLLDFPARQSEDNTQIDLPDLRPLEEFFKGFLNGTRVLSSDNIKNCVNETEFVVKSVEDANAEFKKDTPEGFRAGVLELTDIFEHLKPLNVDCNNASYDIEEVIKKYIKTFQSPIDILFNAARHFNSIYDDIKHIMDAYPKGDWKYIGHESGDIMYQIFFDH